MHAAQSNTAGTKARILVATGNAITREILVQLLRVAGYEGLPAATGERALVTLREQGRRIDALVSDVELPHLVDGWILADEFRSLHPGRPIVLAAATPAGRRADSLQALVVPTPMSPQDLLSSLEGLFGHPEVRPAEPAAEPRPAAEPQRAAESQPAFAVAQQMVA